MTKDIRITSVDFEGDIVVVRYTKFVNPNSRARMVHEFSAIKYWNLVENMKLVDYLEKLL